MNHRPRQWIRPLLLTGVLLVGAIILLGGQPKDPEQGVDPGGVAGPPPSSSEPGGRRWGQARTRSATPPAPGPLDTRSAGSPPATMPAQTLRFQPEAYAMGRMQIFGRFWKQAEAQWDVADFRLAERDAQSLDGRQSYQVYVYLRTCLDTPRSPAQAERRLGELESAVGSNPRRLEWLFQQVEQGLARCDGLPDELEPLALKWLTRAAIRGYPLAQIAYYRSYRWLTSRKPYLLFGEYDGITRYRHRAAGFLHAALRSGHAEAFVEMGLALAEGVVFPGDPTSAYAHALAARQAGGPDLDLSIELRAKLEPHLDRQQISEATRMAEALCERYCL